MVSIKEKIIEIIGDVIYGEDYDISPSSDLFNDLLCDSLDVLDIVLRIEKEFGIRISDEVMESFHTVDDIINYVSSKEGN